MAGDARVATPQVLGYAELRGLMSTVLGAFLPQRSWRSSVRGSLSAAVWAAQLVGWEFASPIELIDECGFRWVLTTAAPNVVEKHWKQALQRCGVALAVEAVFPREARSHALCDLDVRRELWLEPLRSGWRSLRDPIERT